MDALVATYLKYPNPQMVVSTARPESDKYVHQFVFRHTTCEHSYHANCHG